MQPAAVHPTYPSPRIAIFNLISRSDEGTPPVRGSLWSAAARRTSVKLAVTETHPGVTQWTKPSASFIMVQCNMRLRLSVRTDPTSAMAERVNQGHRKSSGVFNLMPRQSIAISLARAGAAFVAFAVAVTAPLPLWRLSAHAAAEWPMRVRQDIVRLAEIEWRLRDAGTAVCGAIKSDLGIAIDDRRAYDQRYWPLLATTIGLREFPVVVGVVPNTPASRVGLREGDELLAIDDASTNAIIQRHDGKTPAADAIIDAIASTPLRASLKLKIRRNGNVFTFAVTPISHCAARLVLITDDNVEAHSDDRNVAISSGLIAMARNDDEIALAAGHELAHIILQHQKGSGINTRRRMEDEADLLGLRLMNCAGYTPSRGFELFRRLGKKEWLGFLRAPTHRSFAKRVYRLESEVPKLACPVSASNVSRD